MQASARTDSDRRRSRLRVHPEFRSRFLPGDRDVLVYLPPGYEADEGRAYPILFMNDGQNLFDPAPSSPESAPEPSSTEKPTWRMAEAADAAIEAGEIEPLLLVGVAHAGERRLAEYTPTSDWKLGGGQADKYGRMLVEELLPMVAANYRVRPGAEHTGLGGSSLGGLAALYLGLKYADVFGKLAVLSPSVWWNHRAILALVDEAAPRLRARPRIWLDTGDAEGRRAVADADLLDRRLRAKGWRPGADLRYEQIPGGTHDEASWAGRVRPLLRFLYPGKDPGNGPRSG